MLNCKQAATLASDYLDKNTTAELNWKIRLHLIMCSHCRRFYRQLKITNKVARSVLSEPSDENLDILLERIKHSAKTQNNKPKL